MSSGAIPSTWALGLTSFLANNLVNDGIQQISSSFCSKQHSANVTTRMFQNQVEMNLNAD